MPSWSLKLRKTNMCVQKYPSVCLFHGHASFSFPLFSNVWSLCPGCDSDTLSTGSTVRRVDHKPRLLYGALIRGEVIESDTTKRQISRSMEIFSFFLFSYLYSFCIQKVH